MLSTHDLVEWRLVSGTIALHGLRDALWIDQTGLLPTLLLEGGTSDQVSHLLPRLLLSTLNKERLKPLLAWPETFLMPKGGLQFSTHLALPLHRLLALIEQVHLSL